MKLGSGLAHIRQLCCLDLSVEAIISELLRALHSIIPSGPNIFCGIMPGTAPSYIIPEYVIPEVLDLFRRECDQLIPASVIKNSVHWFATNPVIPDPAVVMENFYQSGLYKSVWQPYNMHYSMLGAVKENDSIVGVLLLSRAHTEPPFSRHEHELFARILPYVTHALHVSSSYDEVNYINSGQTGMLILDLNGRLAHMSDKTRELLYLAYNPRFSCNVGPAPLAAILLQLRQRLTTVFQNDDTPSIHWCHQNPWGQFLFRAYQLHPMEAGAQQLIGIAIEHQEPQPLKIMREMLSLPLSPVQRSVCLLLVQGHSQEQIASLLNIRINTLKDHVRKLYDKLGIHHRENLNELLLAANS